MANVLELTMTTPGTLTKNTDRCKPTSKCRPVLSQHHSSLLAAGFEKLSHGTCRLIHFKATSETKTKTLTPTEPTVYITVYPAYADHTRVLFCQKHNTFESLSTSSLKP